MKTIVIANPKGGNGKSTISFNLANFVQYSKNKRVLLTDSDPQQSLKAIEYEQREDGLESAYQIREFCSTSPSKWKAYLEQQNKIDFHLIDTSGSLGGSERGYIFSRADAIIVPFVMQQMAVTILSEFLYDLEAILPDREIPILGVMNMAKRTKEQHQLGVVEGIAGMKVVGLLADRVRYSRYQRVDKMNSDEDLNILMETIYQNII